MKKEVIYIAGKITGDPDYKAKFRAAAKQLESVGYIVLNPAVLPEGLTPADYMRICFAMMEAADKVGFLPDYRDSRGAMIENNLRAYCGKPADMVEDLILEAVYASSN